MNGEINKRGMTLLPLILMIVIVTGLLLAGITLVGPVAKRAKYNDTQTNLDAIIKTIISWSVASNRIPDISAGSTGFARVTGNSNDAWGKPFVYIAADNLLNPSPVGICNRSTTNLSVSTLPGPIAFVIISGGDDYTINSTPNTSQAYSGTVTVSQSDVVKWITLNELQNKAGCYSTAQGRLKILNNELPKARSGTSSYSATVFADGGVGTLNWTVTNTPPWMRCNGGSCSGSFTGSSISLSAGSQITTGGIVTFSITDSDGNNTQKALPIDVI